MHHAMYQGLISERQVTGPGCMSTWLYLQNPARPLQIAQSLLPPPELDLPSQTSQGFKTRHASQQMRDSVCILGGYMTTYRVELIQPSTCVC